MKRNTFARTAVGAALISVALIGLAATNASGAEPEGTACNAADLAAPHGVLDLYDVVKFVHAFENQASPADMDDNKVWDLNDIAIFIDTFNAGCPS